MSPKEFVEAFNRGCVFSAKELNDAETKGLLGTHGPGSTYQLTEQGFNLLNFGSTLTPKKAPTPKAAPTSAVDTQVGGDHYKTMGDYQPWQVLAEWMTPEELRGYMKGTVIAYLAREKQKGGDQDIAKALHTMQLWQEVRKDAPCK